MRTIRRSRSIFFMTMLLAATPLLAQERCSPSNTIAQCFERYLQPYVQLVEKKESNDLERQPTGVDTGGANVATNTKDFNPIMALAGLLGTDTDGTDNTQGTMVFNFNFPLHTPGSKGAKNAQFQALVNTQPEISELVRNAIPEPDRDAGVSQLEEEIADLADHTIRFTYNHTSRSLGRSFEQYEDRFEDMCEGVMGSAAATKATLRKLSLPSDMPFEDMPPEVAAQALRLVEEEAKARQLMGFPDQALRQAGIQWYDQLLDNQPQLHITVDKRFREPLVGPDELSVRVTYEWSRANLNAATEGCGPDWGSATCLDWYKKYVDEKQEAIENGNRFSLVGEYVDADGETIDTGLSGVAPIVLESASKLVLSLGWSRKILLSDGKPVKLDLVASYEDVSDDPDRQNRGIASLTFTRKVGMMDIPFGIVYASRPEFLPDVDARLSAHLGLKFNMSGGNGDREQ